MNTPLYMESVSRRPKEPPTPMARWVRDVREGAGLTQDEFGAKLLGREGKPVHRQTVTSWESGDYEPKRDMVEQIMRKFPRAQRPPSTTDAPAPEYANEQATGASLMRAIERWAISVGLPSLSEDDEFYAGVVNLWDAHRRRRAGVK